MTTMLTFHDELSLLTQVLPAPFQTALQAYNSEELIEVVLDLGRPPEARFTQSRFADLGEQPVTQDQLDSIVSQIGAFSGDNRAGIPKTLHRISCMRNRQGHIIGLTCRVGKALSGTIKPIEDLVLSGQSILILGRPGVGKTTKLREIARLLAGQAKKRVVIVDTSNEIAGDGDIPHAAVGRARRMQVPHPDQQQQIMIEAVENHTPEVIIVDEIGTEAEALAARTIAERGVMLIATAHGTQLENLIKNPMLSDLIGGIQSVTLGDEEAKRRASQKTILEREKHPTFELAIELRDRNSMAVYPNLAEAVDHLLRGWTIFPEVRKLDESGKTVVLKSDGSVLQGQLLNDTQTENSELTFLPKVTASTEIQHSASPEAGHNDEFRVYLYAITSSFLERTLQRLNLQKEVKITNTMHDAHAVIALRGQARPGSKVLRLATDYDIPIYYAKINTMPQIQKALREALEAASRDETGVFANRWKELTQDWLTTLSVGSLPGGEEAQTALKEAQIAIKTVQTQQESVELAPQRSYIRRLQHELVEKYNLMSVSIGDEPNRRLKIIANAQ